MAVDYRDLLKRYIAHVRLSEGSTFLNYIKPLDHPDWSDPEMVDFSLLGFVFLMKRLKNLLFFQRNAKMCDITQAQMSPVNCWPW
jgi:hypothetical protein